MKIIANREELIRALAIVAKGTAGRTPKPVLQCVRIVPKSTGLVLLEATDLETYIQAAVTHVEISDAESTAVKAVELLKALRSFDGEDTIILETVGEKLVVKGNRAKVSYYTANPAEMPPVPDRKNGFTFDVAPAHLDNVFDVMSKIPAGAASSAQKGLLFDVKNGSLSIVGTDGRRMGEMKCEVSTKTAISGIIPTHPIEIIVSAAAESNDPISITISDNAAMLSTGGLSVCTSLIEGQFPPYESLVPTGGGRVATLKREEFLSALRQSMLTTTEESKGARFTFTETRVSISTMAAGLGDSLVQCSCKYQGQDLEIGFNPRYWSDVLSSLAVDEIRIEMISYNRPALLTVPGLRYVLMPINLK